MNKAKLIKRCIEKDQKAWEEFFKKYSRLIYWAINRRLSAINSSFQQSDIEDIFQEVFLALFQENKLSGLKDSQLLPGWLTMVAANKTSDYMRRKFRNRENLGIDFSNLPDNSHKDKAFNCQVLDLISRIVDNLSDKEKIIFSLNIFENKTHREIGEITKTPLNTVSTIVARTKEKVKNQLKKMKEKWN